MRGQSNQGSRRSVAHQIAMDDLLLMQTMERVEALPSDFLQAIHLRDGAVVHHMERRMGWGRAGGASKSASPHTGG